MSDPSTPALDRCQKARASGNALFPCGVHTAAWTAHAHPAKRNRTLQPTVPHRCRHFIRGCRQSRTSRSQDRLLQYPAHVGTKPPIPSSRPLCHSGRRTLAGSHALDSLARRVLLADPGSQQSVPRKVRRCIEARASPRPIDLCRIDPTHGRPEMLRSISPNIVPSGLGCLCEAGIRWPRAGSSLLGTIHAPHCHLQSPASLIRWHARDVSMEGLCSG